MENPDKKPELSEDERATILDIVVQNFESAENNSLTEREEAEQARDYFDGKQWTSEEEKGLRERKQAPITDNMLKDKIEYMVGMEAASRTDPKAYPRTPHDEESAEAATDALRYVQENNDVPTQFSDNVENQFIEGYGALEIVAVNKPSGEKEIAVRHVPWDRTYYDQHSIRKDFSDARYRGVFVWMDVEDAKIKWPNADWDSIATDNDSMSDTFGDKPSDLWYDCNRKRVRVVEQYFRYQGKVWYAKFTKGSLITPPTVSPYLNEDGLPEDPYAWQSAYVDRDGNRYGVVRRYKDLQDEINHRRSRALFILNSNQLLAEEGAFVDANKARKEANKPDGYLEYAPGLKVEIRSNTELASGQAGLLADARQALATTGPKAVNNTSPSQSGRAKQLDQQTDVLELGRLFDQQRAQKRQMYKKVWNRVKQFWTDEKWVRIRDEEGKPSFAQLNHPVTAEEEAQELAQKGEQIPQEVLMHLNMGNVNQVVRTRNDVTEMDVDIIIDEAPDILTVQQEQFADLVSLAQVGVVYPPDVYLEASSLRNKDKLKEKLTGGDDPEAQAAAEQQKQIEQMMLQLEAADKSTKADEQAAKARKTHAEAEEQELTNMLGKSATAQLAME